MEDPHAGSGATRLLRRGSERCDWWNEHHPGAAPISSKSLMLCVPWVVHSAVCAGACFVYWSICASGIAVRRVYSSWPFRSAETESSVPKKTSHWCVCPEMQPHATDWLADVLLEDCMSLWHDRLLTERIAFNIKKIRLHRFRCKPDTATRLRSQPKLSLVAQHCKGFHHRGLIVC